MIHKVIFGTAFRKDWLAKNSWILWCIDTVCCL